MDSKVLATVKMDMICVALVLVVASFVDNASVPLAVAAKCPGVAAADPLSSQVEAMCLAGVAAAADRLSRQSSSFCKRKQRGHTMKK